MKRTSRPWRLTGLSLALLFLVESVAGFLNPFLSDSAWAQKAQEIEILHTNNVTGHVFGCPT